MNKFLLSTILIFCTSVVIVWLGWVAVLTVGLLSLGYIAIRFLMCKFSKKLHKIFN